MKPLSILSLALLSAFSLPLGRAADAYHLEKEIPIGGEGGWDCLSIDATAHRLYVTHATKIVVIDLEKNTVIGSIDDTPGVHGFALVPDLGKGFSSNGKENKSSIVDLKTLKTLAKVDTGANPDIIIYEPGQKEIWCFNGRANSATVIDAATGKVTATVSLPGKPEFAESDPQAGKVYVNLEDKNAVAVLDTRSHTVETTWPIAPGESASGLAIDTAHHRLFLGCDNKLMILLDSTSGKVLGSVPIGSRIDGTAYDPATGLAFASGGDGTTTIAKEETPGQLAVVQTLTTEPSARTIALDPTTHKIYLASAKFEPEAPAKAGTEHPRPKIIPGTMKILVYAP